MSPGKEIGAGHLVDLGLSGGEHPVCALYVQFPTAVQQVSGQGGLTCGGKVGGFFAGFIAPLLEKDAAALCHLSFQFHPLMYIYMCVLEQSSLVEIHRKPHV